MRDVRHGGKVRGGEALVAEVAERLRELAPGARTVALGLSGGPDSVAALLLLLDAGIDVMAVHFDHHLREGSAADRAFVEALCERLQVPLRVGGADVATVSRERGWNVEDGARRLRYDFLHRAAAAGAADGIVVAHTLDDQAETVLLQLLRGAAFATGMPGRRGALLRPLLGIERARLRTFLADGGVAFRDDESNHDLARSRAWVRARVLPALEARMPGAARRLARTAALQADARDALEGIARRRFGDGPLQQAALSRAAPALQRSALARLLSSAGVPVSSERIEAIRSALNESGPWRSDVGSGRVVRVAYGRVEVARRSLAVPARPVREPGELPVGVDPGVLTAYPALEIRNRRHGDRIRLTGGSRLLSDLLIDRKVPRESRDGLRLLASGRDVLWVEGVAAAEGVLSGEGRVDADEAPMRRALALAADAGASGELPVGAVVTVQGRVVGEGANRSEIESDPTAHAEMLALRAAAAEQGDWRLSGATLYVTLEPCPMCLGAVLQAHVARVVYGADNVREGALGGAVDLLAGDLKRNPEVRAGVLAAESADLLKAFFRSRRG
jgi:tRNA(Ile)-lysidine synthase